MAKEKKKTYMVWGKLRTKRDDELFTKFYLANGERDAINYIKKNSKYYDDLRAYRWSSENHDLNYNPNTPDLIVPDEYMYPLGTLYKI